MPCLSEATIITLLERSVTPTQRQVVDQHLASCGECRRLVSALAQLEPAPCSGDPALAIGNVVADRYRLERWLGSGERGELWEAGDRLRNQRIALELLHPTASVRADDLRRARAVRHPSIRRLLDDGVHRTSEGGEPVPFVVMELLPGETLQKHLRSRGRLAARDAWPLVEAMASGLRAAHRAGLVHGALKSTDITLVVDARAPSGRRVVITGVGLGPIRSARRPEPAVDVRGLGAVLFEMVTGREPGPAAVRPRTLAPDLSAGWEKVILGCLTRPSRFPDVPSMLRALRRATEAPRRRGRRFARMAAGWRARWRRRVAWMMAVAALLTVAVLLGVTIGRARSRGRMADVAASGAGALDPR